MFAGFVVALLIALLLTLTIVIGFRRKGPWGTGWTVFVIMFLALWAVSLYFRTFGPLFYGIALTPILAVGIFAAILLAVIMPGANQLRDRSMIGSEHEKIQKTGKSSETYSSRSFWVTILFFIVIIIIGMFNPQFAL